MRNKLPLVLAAFILPAIMSTYGAESSDTIFEWEPFRIRTDLELSIKTNVMNKALIYYSSDLSHVAEGSEAFQDSFNDKRNDGWNELNLRYFKIYLSTVKAAPEKGGLSRVYGSKTNKLEMIRSLPSTVQNAPSRAAVESLGKIFEPQIKLGIDF